MRVDEATSSTATWMSPSPRAAGAPSDNEYMFQTPANVQNESARGDEHVANPPVCFSHIVATCPNDPRRRRRWGHRRWTEWG